jgi:hypothetical protein
MGKKIDSRRRYERQWRGGEQITNYCTPQFYYYLHFLGHILGAATDFRFVTFLQAVAVVLVALLLTLLAERDENDNIHVD